MKRFIIGLLIGVLITSTITFALADEIQTFIAERAGFPILVDGQEVKLDMPAVTIEGRTYLPLRALGEVLGVTVDWNADKGQAEVWKEGKPVETTKPQGKYTPPDDVINNDSYILIKDGCYYATASYVADFLQIKGGYKYKGWNDEAKILIMQRGNEPQIALQMVMIDGIHSGVTYDYFVEHIMPLAKK